jgi:hypothetical protein
MKVICGVFGVVIDSLRPPAALWIGPALVLIVFLGAERLPAQTVGRITGVVRDASTQKPIAGAEVILPGGHARLTDTDGRYHFSSVPPGSLELHVRSLGYTPLLLADVLVRADRSTVLAHELRPAALELDGVEVTYVNYFDRGISGGAPVQGIRAEEVRRTPGAIGDVLRLAQSFPGVAVTNDTRNDLVVRGGSPGENLTLVDGIEVPTLNHFSSQNTSGGPVSMLNTDLISEADFSAGGFEARHADRLSSVLDIELREGSRVGGQYAVDMGAAGFGAIGEGPLGTSGSWLVSLRRSYLELLQGAIGLTAVPEYWNLNAKVAWDLTPRDRVWGIAIGGIDEVRFDVDPDDPEDPSLLDTEFDGWRTIVGGAWRRGFDWGFGTLSLSDAASSNAVVDRDARLGDALVFDQNDRDGVTTLKYDLRARLSPVDHLRLGVGGRRHRGRYDIAAPLGVESPFSVAAERVNPVDVETDVTSLDLGAHAEYTRRLGGGVELTVGTRVDRWELIDEARVSPRARLRVSPASTLDLSLSAGVYHQGPPLVFLGAVPENRALEPIRAEHLVVSAAAFPRTDVRIGVEAYRKRYDDYPVSTQFPALSLADTGTEYGVSQLLFPMTAAGTGEARGIELSVQKKYTGDWYGQLSYSLSESDQAALDGISRPAAFDIRHLFSTFGGFSAGAWNLSGKYTFASGRPYTPFLTVASVEQNRGIYDLDRIHAERSPAFHRLDLRVERRFTVGGSSLFVFADVVNVTNRVNAQQRIWNGKTGSADWLDQFALVPNVGLSLTF